MAAFARTGRRGPMLAVDVADEPRRASIAARAGYWICGVLWPAVGFRAALATPGPEPLIISDGRAWTSVSIWMFPGVSEAVCAAMVPFYAACAALLPARPAAFCAGLTTGLALAWAGTSPFLGLVYGAVPASVVAARRSLATMRAGGRDTRRRVVGGWLIGTAASLCPAIVAVSAGRETRWDAPLSLAFWAVFSFLFWLATVVADETARGDRAAVEAGTP